ncbi:MAG: EamA family transporter [Flavobacterium sp.]|jgi:drug/metabolite transporter (DMT)-like permease|uniref:DMT family transporter n=1 Tax=Flavobacterium TaxID=237 RepID=UPI0022BBC1B8|nr:EamA family transporter [Flavobacterium sp.]MCZ8091808.1 EamA family transporter [Flavobacterium sp.]MCZ8331591.1 EamA family transporter [Flavobacterium sp.]
MNSKHDFKLLFCLLMVAVVWGTTYLGIRVAVETIPAWYITSVRQGLAGLLILIFLLYKKQLAWIGWENFKLQFIPAILMIVIANGFTTIAEKTVPSGLTSILSALSPLVVFLGSTIIGLQKPTFKGFVGVFIGFLGVVFIFRDGLGDILDPNYKIGILFLSIAILSWSIGTVYTKLHVHKSTNIALNLFYQFSIAAIIQFVLALIFNPNVDFSKWSSRSIIATLYLAVFGSVIAFFCYHYAIKRVSAIQVSVLNYINTIIAVFLGWLLLDEVIKLDFVIATMLIIVGVFITNYKRK